MHSIDHLLYHHHLHHLLHLLLVLFLLGSRPCCCGRLPVPLEASLLFRRVPREVSRGSLSVFWGVSPPAYDLVPTSISTTWGCPTPAVLCSCWPLVPNMLCQYWTTSKSLMCTIPRSSKTSLLHRNHARSDHLSSDAAFLLLWVSFILSLYGIEQMSLGLSQNQYPEHTPLCLLHPLALAPPPHSSSFPCSPSVNTHPY